MKHKLKHGGLVFTLKSKFTDNKTTTETCAKCDLDKGPLCGPAPACDLNEYYKITEVRTA